MLKPISRIIIGFLFSIFAPTSWGEIPPFTASYTLHQGPVTMGRVELKLKQLPGGQYELKSITEPHGMLAFVRDDVVTETSHFIFRNNTLLPLQYEYHQSDDDEEVRRVELVFDWAQQEVTNTVKGHSWKMTIPDKVQDKASIQLALMLELAQGNLNPQFQVADGGKLKQYQFEFLGEETIQVNEQNFETLKMIRHKNKKSSDTTFWCDPNLNFLPVRIIKEKGLGKFSMDLDEVRFEIREPPQPDLKPTVEPQINYIEK